MPAVACSTCLHPRASTHPPCPPQVISLMLSVLDEIVEGMSMNFAGVSLICGPVCSLTAGFRP